MSDYFPLEVVVEILQRLPVKSLVRCLCVCKEWKSVITDHAFCISHHQLLEFNHANSSLFFHLRRYRDDDYNEAQLKDEYYSLYSDDDATDSLALFKFPPFFTFSWRVFGTCNGLVCFADYYNQAVIWNPSIHKYLILPKPSLTFETPTDMVFYGLSFDSCSHDFKVVRIVCGDAKISPQVEIYSLSSHSWRSITVAAFPFSIASLENKFVNGLLHWLAYRKINGMRNFFILTFDVVEERFGELMLPKGLESDDAISILRGGNLLALDHKRYIPWFRIIWVMKEYGVVESWTKLFHFDSTRPNYLGRPGALRNNEEAVLQDCHKIAFVDPIKGLVKKIAHSCYMILFMGDYVESLFLINDENAKTYLPLGFSPLPSPYSSTPSWNQPHLGIHLALES